MLPNILYSLDNTHASPRKFTTSATQQLIALVLCVMLTSCGCDCDCYKEPGCRTMTARRISDGTLIETATHCSQTSVDFDPVMQDSVYAFKTRHGYGYSVSQTDSAAGGRRVMDLSCKEGKKHENEGYHCVCVK